MLIFWQGFPYFFKVWKVVDSFFYRNVAIRHCDVTPGIITEIKQSWGGGCVLQNVKPESHFVKLLIFIFWNNKNQLTTF